MRSQDQQQIMEKPRRVTQRILSKCYDLQLGKERKQIELKAEPVSTIQYETFERTDTNGERLPQEDLEFISSCLERHFIFSGFFHGDSTLTARVSQTFFRCRAQPGVEVIRQNDGASFFFIIRKGEVEILVNGLVRKTIGPGEGFGEMALLYNAPRSASCRTKSECELLGIDRRSFRKAVEEMNVALHQQHRQMLNRVKFFDSMDPETKDQISHMLIFGSYDDGAIICNQGQQASSFYIITRGKVKVLLKGKECGRLKEGDSFGENALLSQNQVRQLTVVADGKLAMLSLGRQSITRLLGRNLLIIIMRNKIKSFMAKSQVFNKLGQATVDRIIDCLEVRRAEAGEKICVPGQTCRDNLFFVLEGQCLRNGSKYDYRGVFHGEDSIKPQKGEQRYEHQIEMSTTGTVAQITFQALCKQIRDSYQQAPSKAMLTSLAHLAFSQALLRKRKKFEQVGLSDLICLKKLGAGQFGEVFLVAQRGEQGQLLALKSISKVQMLESRLESHLEQQKRMLEVVNFPMIVEYIRSYKDEANIYFLLEYIRGVNLSTAMRLQGGMLGPGPARFYTASLVLILQYLHSLLTIYRDLKPENVMLNQRGYLKLVDMGACKHLKSKYAAKSYTIIGTPHYMAPEALSGMGYFYSADLWSLGVCLYEFRTAEVPYGMKANDPYQIYEEIVNHELKFPRAFDPAFTSLVTQLLSKAPEERLGAGGYPALKEHAFFGGFDWDELGSLKMMPPFSPLGPSAEQLQRLIAGGKPFEQVKARLNLGGVLTRKDYDPHWDRMY